MLSDYVPFYFTPYSVMMYQIKTGYNGIRQRRNDEIAIIVASLHKIWQQNRELVFTDRHASLRTAQFFSDLGDLSNLDWEIWTRRDFKGDPEDPDKKDRYQAEALICRHLTMDACLGIVCYNENTTNALKERLGETGEA
jgi:hypothetical protein